MIHWCGTGLSAVPGLRRLIEAGHPVTVWNRTVAKAEEAVGDLTQQIRAFDLETLQADLAAGDVVVSMLPGDWHVPLAEACLAKDAHFVSSSYIAPEMRALHDAAVAKGLSFVNEVGLDPGIDHLMAHAIMADYTASDAFDPSNTLDFISYCGGIPKEPNPFRYKFSWSPVGVLKALRSPSTSILDGEVYEVSKPWEAVTSYTAPLPEAESFEVYPNRDSRPFMAEYGFAPDWPVERFVRGTLRLNGWKEAWADVFAEMGTASDARLKEMSDGFWAENAYDAGEPDRVVLCVALAAKQGGSTVYHKTYVLDAWGADGVTAMARLVSVPVSLAIEAVLAGQLSAGVQAAPSAPALVSDWLEVVDTLAQHLQLVDHIG